VTRVDRRQPDDGVAEVFAATALDGQADHRLSLNPDEDLAGSKTGSDVFINASMMAISTR
jgi:hypothetical protein